MSYSQKEIALAKFFSYEDLMYNDTITPSTLYAMMMKSAFLHNYKGEAVESLRRCIKAIDECNPYRETKEWDDLIEL
jgi:hypothetical protein